MHRIPLMGESSIRGAAPPGGRRPARGGAVPGLRRHLAGRSRSGAHALGDGRAKELIFDAFGGRQPVLPICCLRDVARLALEDERQRALVPGRTFWSLNIAFTDAVKRLRPTLQHQAGLRIGRLFGKVLHRGSGAVAIPEGVEVID
jgi:hypothetical protein